LGDGINHRKLSNNINNNEVIKNVLPDVEFSLFCHLDFIFSPKLNSEMNTHLLFLALVLSLGILKTAISEEITTPTTSCCPRKVDR